MTEYKPTAALLCTGVLFLKSEKFLSMNQTLFCSNGDQIRKSLQTLALTVGLLTTVLLNPATAQEKLLRTLTVTGRGIESIQTTRTQVQLGVEVQGQSATGVQQDVARRSASVVELLRARNVEKL